MKKYLIFLTTLPANFSLFLPNLYQTKQQQYLFKALLFKKKTTKQNEKIIICHFCLAEFHPTKIKQNKKQTQKTNSSSSSQKPIIPLNIKPEIKNEKNLLC